ncbi:MAG: NADH-quinone oxidoreductase subunit N [Halioglobus sp.]|nr:NADH-quinone oxidoreductase subunit N [Halioglobus sp.]
MSGSDFQALLPLIILAGGATALMLQIAFLRRVNLTAALAVLVLAAAAISCLYAAPVTPVQVTPLMVADRLALLFCVLFCTGAAATALLSLDYIRCHGDEPEEYFLLLLLSTLGACVLAYSTHVASLMLGLELLSVSLYALVAYPSRSMLPLEAAVKYLVLSGAASATMLFGFALVYAMTGAMEFSALGQAIGEITGSPVVVVTGSAMVLAGLAFKISAVPFHLWTPDVYQGAPAPVSGYLATVGKAAVFVALLRLFLDADLFRYTRLVELVGLMAILGMLAGNLLALLQTNLKRMLAYSSIAHIGYLLIVFMACLRADNRDLAIEASIFYLIAYTATTIAAFGMLSLLNSEAAERENVELHQIDGLFWRRPTLAVLMTVALLSLAGIPLTAGFIAKFYLFSAAVMGGNWVLLAALIAGSGIGIYYYLRAIYTMTRRPGEQTPPQPPPAWRDQAVPLALIAIILLLGTVPQPLVAYIGSIM